MSISEKFLTEAQLATLLEISASKLRSDRLLGKGLPFVRLPGRTIRYPYSAVAKYLAEHSGGECPEGKAA